MGNYPGRALSFSLPPGSSTPELHSLPSKRVGLYAPHTGSLIARSDTNGEDLEAFAGAGLYDRCVGVCAHACVLTHGGKRGGQQLTRSTHPGRDRHVGTDNYRVCVCVHACVRRGAVAACAFCAVRVVRWTVRRACA